MIHISGAFVYQPSSSPRPGVSYPATFLIKLVIMRDDGAPVFNANEELLERLRAFVVLGYPQVTLYNWPLTLTNLFPVFNAPFEAREYFQLRGVYDFSEDPHSRHRTRFRRPSGSTWTVSGERSSRRPLLRCPTRASPRPLNRAASGAIAGPPSPPPLSRYRAAHKYTRRNVLISAMSGVSCG